MNGKQEVLAFIGYGLKFTTPTASRTTPIGQVQYIVDYYQATGTTPLLPPWKYESSAPTTNPLNGVVTLNNIAHTDTTSTKYYTP